MSCDADVKLKCTKSPQFCLCSKTSLLQAETRLWSVEVSPAWRFHRFVCRPHRGENADDVSESTEAGKRKGSSQELNHEGLHRWAESADVDEQSVIKHWDKNGTSHKHSYEDHTNTSKEWAIFNGSLCRKQLTGPVMQEVRGPRCLPLEEYPLELWASPSNGKYADCRLGKRSAALK